jgi:uncharacterized membrane protein SpoIIM required for sporulation
MRRKFGRQHTGNIRSENNGSFLYLLAFCFLAGSLSGCIVGFLSAPGNGQGALSPYMDQNADLASFFLSLWACSKYHLLALFLAGSVFGALALPLLCVFRGYLLGCAASALTAMKGGFFLSLVVIGLPSIFSLPALILLCDDGMSVSRYILQRSLGRPVQSRHVPLANHLILAAALLTVSALIQQLLIPAFLTRVF